MKSLLFCTVVAGLVGTACTKKSDGPDGSGQTAAQMNPIQLAEKGKTIFQMNCTSCHGSDPHKDGPIGPAIYGSPMELIEARVLRAAYPPSYQPKRTTSAMIALPHLKADLPAIHAYLNSPSL